MFFLVWENKTPLYWIKRFCRKVFSDIKLYSRNSEVLQQLFVNTVIDR